MSALDTLQPELGDDSVSDWLPTGVLGSPATVPLVVETLLRAALERLDAESVAAHAEAHAAVAAAVRRSAELALSSSGQLPPTFDGSARPVPVGSTEPSEDHLGPLVSARSTAQVYDLFWSEIPSDQPIRERLRRWAQRPVPSAGIR